MAEGRDRSRFAIVGGDSLLGKEIHDLLQESKPAPSVELISATAAEATSILESEREDATVLNPLTKESLAGAKIAFLAGSPASSRRALKLSPKSGPALIDLTGALDDQVNARLRAPSAEAASPGPVARGDIQVIAHPAAIAITTLLAALSREATLRRSVIHVFDPASERGKAGVEELQQQNVAVLSFKKLKTDVFDAQLAFNLLARLGEEAAEPMEGIEQRAERHLASLLAAYPDIPMPSLRMIQAPVFHGHSLSVWIEFAENPGPATLGARLAVLGIDVRPDDPPSNVSVAGQSGLSVGAIAVDSNNPRACWLWAAADNVKLAAENALAVAREIAP